MNGSIYRPRVDATGHSSLGVFVHLVEANHSHCAVHAADADELEALGEAMKQAARELRRQGKEAA